MRKSILYISYKSFVLDLLTMEKYCKARSSDEPPWLWCILESISKPKFAWNKDKNQIKYLTNFTNEWNLFSFMYLMRNIINIFLRCFHFSYNIIMNFTHITLPPKEVQMCIHKSTFSCYLTVWWVVNNVFNELIKVWNTIFYLNKIKIFDFPYFRRKLWCIQFFKKNSDFFFLISALASKKWSNRKSQCTLIYWL